MKQKVALFWPGDGRDLPNQLAMPNITEATAQLEAALRRLGRQPYVVEGFLAKPHHAIEKLAPIDDPLIGVCVHWFYAPTPPTEWWAKTIPCSWRAISRASGPAWWACSTPALA